MNEKQIPKLLAALVEHQSGFVLLPTRDAQWAIIHPKEAIELCAEAILNRNESQEERSIPHSLHGQCALWKKFYTQYFGVIHFDSFDPKMPLPQPGFGWLIPVQKGLTINRVVEVMRTKMNVCSYMGEDLDAIVTPNERVTDKNYAILVP